MLKKYKKSLARLLQAALFGTAFAYAPNFHVKHKNRKNRKNQMKKFSRETLEKKF